MRRKEPIDLDIFKEKVKANKRKMRTFLNVIGERPPRKLNKLTETLEKNVWKEVDCLSCANCCKKMTPTFTERDLRRIAGHLGQTVEDFKKKWLRKERKEDGDWINKKQPCQFLNPADNKCSIYAVRPADCSGFPHLPKKMKDYVHVHKQNIEFCPATYRIVELMMQHSPRIM